MPQALIRNENAHANTGNEGATFFEDSRKTEKSRDREENRHNASQ